MMAKHATLNDAMAAGDELAEAEIRYRLLAEVFEDSPQLRANLNPALERAKAEILRLRATKAAAADTPTPAAGAVVAFDASRFRKSASSP